MHRDNIAIQYTIEDTIENIDKMLIATSSTSKK